jgi:hypothetical protein
LSPIGNLIQGLSSQRAGIHLLSLGRSPPKPWNSKAPHRCYALAPNRRNLSALFHQCVPATTGGTFAKVLPMAHPTGLTVKLSLGFGHRGLETQAKLLKCNKIFTFLAKNCFRISVTCFCNKFFHIMNYLAIKI